MTHDAFVAMFAEVVFKPTIAAGFRFIGKSQTIAYDAAALTVALVRLGGRFARPGSIAHVLCARHRFLREVNELQVPLQDTTEVVDHPYKYVPSELAGLRPEKWRYIPRNLNYDHDRIAFGDRDVDVVHSELERLQHFLVGPVRQWAAEMTPAKATEDLRTYGTGAWCERIWLEDYEKHSA